MSDQINENDIVFECPHCGKSIAIEDQAAGMVVICPDCQGSVKVPGEFDRQLSPASAFEEQDVPVEELSRKLDLMKKELALIQAAVDRMVSALQD